MGFFFFACLSIFSRALILSYVMYQKHGKYTGLAVTVTVSELFKVKLEGTLRVLNLPTHRANFSHLTDAAKVLFSQL